LLELGLNNLEAKTYLALQGLGEAKTGDICKRLGIPNSHIYPTLAKLQEKGLVSYKYANKIKVFKAANPENLKHLFDEKQRELKAQESNLLKLISELQKLPKNKETDSDYQYFEGIKAVKGMILDVYSTAPKNSEMKLLSAVSESWEIMNAFFLEMHDIRLKRNISLKMIMQKKTKDLKKRVEERMDIGKVSIRLADFNNLGELFLTKDYLIILDTSKSVTPCSFMIKNKVFLSMFDQLYEYIWNSLKN